MADRVLDGTPCGPYETDLCVHGKCQVTYFFSPWWGFGEETLSPQTGSGVEQRSQEASGSGFS